MKDTIFKNFTGMYPIQKTLRFALDNPVGDSLKNLKKEFDKERQTFKRDQEIQNAYQILKPEIDKVHDFFINASLESNIAKEISFDNYWKYYEERKNSNDKKKNESTDDTKDKLTAIEEKLRKDVAKSYVKGGEQLKKIHIDLTWNKGSNKNVTGEKMLFCETILDFVVIENLDHEKIKDAREKFREFYTALSGFNENRKNYYSTEEKSTAISHRIINVNLPKFCDNALLFKVEKHKDRLINAFDELKKTNIELKDKDGESLQSITESIFQVNYFSHCLSQPEIEDYNKKIGNANSVVNLYNQQHSKEKDYIRLPKFKTLHKQIGCGKKDPLFFQLTHDTKEEKNENKEQKQKPYSLEEILNDGKEAGEKYFKDNKENSHEIVTVFDFTKLLRDKSERKDWKGVYWSKTAVNIISNKYFANWHDILDKVKGIKSVASFDRKREEQIKINDAVELKGLFEVIDQEDNLEVAFKPSVIENEKCEKEKTISQNVISFICNDIENNAETFLLGKNLKDEPIKGIIWLIENINKLKSKKEKEEYTETIKLCMDCALTVVRTLKFFLVNENKVKGAIVDVELTNALHLLLNKDNADWSKWYDALRNYLTKKPQDEATKLKLYFQKSTIGDGWSKEQTNLCAIFEKDNRYFLGIIDKKKNTIFQDLDIEFLNEKLSKTIAEKNGKEEKCSKKKDPTTKIYEKLTNEIAKLNKDINELKEVISCLEDGSESYQKMVYKFFKDGTTMIPKCSTQLKEVKKHFKNNQNDYIIKDIKNFLTPLTITKEIYELNNLVYNKNPDLTKDETTWERINEKSSKPKKFQKKYLELSGDESGYKDALKKWIAFCEEFLNSYKKVVEANYDYENCFKKHYDSLDEFYNELNSKIYNISYKKISKKYVDKCIEEEKLYLFEIYSKDFSDKSTGKKNLQTYYWQEVLKEKSSHQLNGGAEIFYRKQVISNANFDKDKGHHYEQQKEHCAKKGKDFFPIIKDKRYTKERFSFHIPITLNYATYGASEAKYALSSFNASTNIYLGGNTCFLGIDRGEKHLGYYCIIDEGGNLIKQESLNIGFKDKDGNPRSTMKDKYTWNSIKKVWDMKQVECFNYNDLLDCAASNRDHARKNWKAIGNIKNLKEGYISQAVNEVTKIIVKTPTYVVLEDLNTGFKRGRQKIEKQVYQKFELALAKKLNFIVDKEKKGKELCSPTNALQLTPPVQNYIDIEDKKQVGIMFYTRANYTSLTDPRTGWRKTVYLKKGEKIETKDKNTRSKSIKDQILNKFIDFGFDGQDYFFKYIANNTGKEWTIWSGKNGKSLDRYRGKRGKDKNEWKVEPFNIPEILDKVFKNFNKNKSFKVQINDGIELFKCYDKQTAWESLRFVIELIQQIRNSDGVDKSGNDNFLYSPVRDEEGNHFDSRSSKEGEPKNADANGAYNIARKGLIMKAHTRQWKIDGMKKYKNKKSDDLSLFVSDEEWDLWLVDRKQWNEKLYIFASIEKMEEYRNSKKDK